MARYRRYRRTIIRVPKKKWASNYINITGQLANGTDGNFYHSQQLAINATESNAPTPVVVKTGNFRVQFDLTLNVAASGAVSARAYIVYIPQGWNIGSDPTTIVNNVGSLVSQHPEWILAWRQLDFGNANAAGSVDTSVVRMSSRLKRNLNTGDRVNFYLIGNGDFTGINFRGNLTGACQFWTCAN